MPRDVARAPAGWVLLLAGVVGLIGAFGPWASQDLAYLPGATLAGKYAVPSSLAVVVIGTLMIVGLGHAWLCAVAMAAGAIGVVVGLVGLSQVHDVAPSLSADWGLVLTIVAGAAEIVAAAVGVTTRRVRGDALHGPVRVRALAESPRPEPAMPDRADAPTPTFAAGVTRPGGVRERAWIAEPWVGGVLAVIGLVGALSTAAPWQTSFLDELRFSGFESSDGKAAAVLMLGVAASGVSIAIRNRSIAAPIVALCCAMVSLLLAFDIYSSIEKLFLRIAIDNDFKGVGWGLPVCAVAAVIAAGVSVRALVRRGPAVVATT